MRSPLRSPAQVEGSQGFLPQPEKDLERPSSTRLEARFPYHDSRAMTRYPSPLAWRPDFPVAPREPHRGSPVIAETTPFVSCMPSRPSPRPLSKRLRRLDSL